jgi:excisionase family DNA binding protein
VDKAFALSALFIFRRQDEMEGVTQLYDVKAAAQMLAISTWTIRAYIRNGKLHPVRFGRLVRLEGQELERFVASGKTPGDRFTNSTKEEHLAATSRSAR